jgi:hypothetical protein
VPNPNIFTASETTEQTSFKPTGVCTLRQEISPMLIDESMNRIAVTYPAFKADAPGFPVGLNQLPKLINAEVCLSRMVDISKPHARVAAKGASKASPLQTLAQPTFI